MEPPVNDVEFVTTASGRVVMVESLGLFDPDEYDEDRDGFTLASMVKPAWLRTVGA